MGKWRQMLAEASDILNGVVKICCSRDGCRSHGQAPHGSAQSSALHDRASSALFGARFVRKLKVQDRPKVADNWQDDLVNNPMLCIVKTEVL